MARSPCKLLFCRPLLAAVSLACLLSPPVYVGAHGPLHDQIEAVTREIEKHPGNADLYWKRAELYRLHRDWCAAEADFERVRLLEPAMHEVELGWALVLSERGRYEEALQAVGRFLSHEPNHLSATFLRARMLAQVGRADDAVCEMECALEVATAPRPEHYLELARLLVDGSHNGGPGPASSADRINRAILVLDKGIERLGPVVTLQLHAIELERTTGRWEDTLRRLDGLASHYSREEVLLAKRGEILEEAGRWMEAQVAFTEALDAITELPADFRRTKATKELEAYLRSALSAPVNSVGSDSFGNDDARRKRP